MARTEEAAALTEQHRLMQLRVRASTLRGFMLLWPLWNGDSASFARLVQATKPLVRVNHQLSATAAVAYYESFRKAEEITGAATPRLAGPIDVQQLVKSMYVTGEVMTKNALASGQSPQEARQTALTRVSGAVTRHALAGGRDTIISSVGADKHSEGWARVTDGDPCAFCAMLAGRGPVYKSEFTADFQAHDHCGCVAEPIYPGATWPGRAREFHDLYNQATRDAAASGELDRGTSNDLLNAFRRVYDAHRASTT